MLNASDVYVRLSSAEKPLPTPDGCAVRLQQNSTSLSTRVWLSAGPQAAVMPPSLLPLISSRLLEAENVRHHISHFMGLESDVRHVPVRGLQERIERRFGHSGRICDGHEARWAVFRPRIVPHHMALGTGAASKGKSSVGAARDLSRSRSWRNAEPTEQTDCNEPRNH